MMSAERGFLVRGGRPMMSAERRARLRAEIEADQSGLQVGSIVACSDGCGTMGTLVAHLPTGFSQVRIGRRTVGVPSGSLMPAPDMSDTRATD